MTNFFEGYSKNEIEETENTVAFFYNALHRIIYMEESTRHYTCFPESDIDCKDYFQKYIDHLSVLLKEREPSLHLIVMCLLDRILKEVNLFLNCFDTPGVCQRWLKLDPKLEYFDVAYDMFGNPEERPIFEKNRQRFRVFVTEERLARRNEYLSGIKKEYEAAGKEFSMSKAYRDEVLRVLKTAFESDFAKLFPNLEFSDKPCDDEPEFINMISPKRREEIDKILRASEERIKNGDVHCISFEEFKERMEYEMDEYVMKRFDEAKEKFENMSLEEFKSYCPTDDLIDPMTGKKAFDDSLTTFERYERFRKLGRKIGYDADASYEAMVIAQLVFPFASRENGWYIAEQDGIIKTKNGKEININPYGLKYELRNDKYDFTLRGDTMNSVATTLKVCSHLINGNDELEQLRDEFIKKYHTFGNFMLLPYRNGVSVNNSRGIKKSHDYFDIFLTAVTKNDLDSILNEASSRLMSEFINECTIMNCGKYYTPFFLLDFLHDNLLAGYIKLNGADRYRFELWEGHDLDNVYPETPEQVKAFFNNATKMIEMRSGHIYKCMKGEIH